MSDTVKMDGFPYCWQEKKGAKSGALHCTEPPRHRGKHYHWPTKTRW